MTASRKGLTLVEIIVVMVIVCVLIAVALPNYYNGMWQSKVQAVENNLLAISAGEQKYYEDHNGYYFATGGGAFTSLNSTLFLNMAQQVNSNFVYACISSGSSYQCTASDVTQQNAGLVASVVISANGGLQCANASGSTLKCP